MEAWPRLDRARRNQSRGYMALGERSTQWTSSNLEGGGGRALCLLLAQYETRGIRARASDRYCEMWRLGFLVRLVS